MLLLEAALEKARRAHRPLIITSLRNPSDDPSQIRMGPALLSALNMQVGCAHLHQNGLCGHAVPTALSDPIVTTAMHGQLPHVLSWVGIGT